jgi:lysophospholipase L1-like esterase
MNPGVQGLAWHTAGGMFRFRTESAAVAVRVELLSADDMSHMPRSGSSGVDLYVGPAGGSRFVRAAMPAAGQAAFEALLFEGTPAPREFTLNFPLYNGLKRLEVGVVPEAAMTLPAPFAVPLPVLFYGSSITQGGCASRPGNAYPHIVARRLGAAHVNYGFSGSARGEPAMADLVASLELGALVLDYDHNAPSVEHLEQTHEPFFQAVRARRPELPVVMVSRPDFDTSPDESRARRAVIRRTYNRAVARGDRGVFMVDGEFLFGKTDRDACTVDGCHPNDLGFLRMADGITPAVHNALQLLR